jgi:hypothetical protein
MFPLPVRETQAVSRVCHMLDLATDRCERMRQKLAAALEARHAAQQQRYAVQGASLRAEDAAAWEAALKVRAARERQCLGMRRSLLAARAGALAGVVSELANARGRLEEANERLSGPEGAGAWDMLHRQLVARQNRLVANLGVAFQIGAWGERVLLLHARNGQRVAHREGPWGQGAVLTGPEPGRCRGVQQGDGVDRSWGKPSGRAAACTVHPSSGSSRPAPSSSCCRGCLRP